MIVICWSLSAPAAAQDPSAEALRALHTQEAAAYRIYRDEAQEELLELRTEPVFTWTNLVGDTTQYGHVFVWDWQGRPETIGTMFSTRDGAGGRKLIHEFHTLSTQRLFPATPEYSAYQWAPEAGIVLNVLREAPVPADTAAGRLRQMRTLARTFAVETTNAEGAKFELRLLPTPIARYESSSQGVHDGALFVMVMSVGTDPEAILMVESRERESGAAQWEAAVVRFSDRDMTVERDGRVLWSSLENPGLKVTVRDDWRLLETRDRTYMCYQARVIAGTAGAAD